MHQHYNSFTLILHYYNISILQHYNSTTIVQQYSTSALQHYTRLLCSSEQAVLRLQHAGAMLHLPDFSMDSVCAVTKYAMTGEVVVASTMVEELVTLGKLLELPGMVQEVGGSRKSWSHYKSPRCSRHLSLRRGSRMLCWGVTHRLVKPHSHPYPCHPPHHHDCHSPMTNHDLCWSQPV